MSNTGVAFAVSDDIPIVNVEEYKSIFFGSGDDIFDARGLVVGSTFIGTGGTSYNGNGGNDLFRDDFSVADPRGDTPTGVLRNPLIFIFVMNQCVVTLWDDRRRTVMDDLGRGSLVRMGLGVEHSGAFEVSSGRCSAVS